MHSRNIWNHNQWSAHCCQVSFFPPSNPTKKKAPKLKRDSQYFLLPDTSEIMEKFPLPFANLCHSYFKMEIPLHIHTALQPYNFSNIKTHCICSCICYKPILLFHQKSTAVIYTEVVLLIQVKNKSFSVMFIHHTEFKKSFWTSKTPQKTTFLHCSSKSLGPPYLLCVYRSHRKFLGWRREAVLKCL